MPEELYRKLADAVEEEALETAGRRLTLAVIDDLWADYLANVAELRGGIHWVAWGGRDPLYEFLTGVRRIYADWQQQLQDEITDALGSAKVRNGEICFGNQERFERGATWTYLTTDQPFGALGERIVKGIKRKIFKR